MIFVEFHHQLLDGRFFVRCTQSDDYAVGQWSR